MTDRPATPPTDFDDEEKHRWVTRTNILWPEGETPEWVKQMATNEILERRTLNGKD